MAPQWLLKALTALALLGAVGAASSPATDHPTPLALVGAVPLDPVLGQAGDPVTVLIEGDRIAGIGLPGSLDLPPGTRTIEASGHFLLPGLWDLHTHISQADDHALPLLVTKGVLGVRDLGGDPAGIETLRARVASGETLGPRIVRAGPTLNGAANGDHHRVIASPEAARQAVDALAAAGVDLIKTHNATDRETYFALLAAAEQAGLTVAGHVPKAVSPLEACQAGQGSIEHIATLFEGIYLSRFPDPWAAADGMTAWLREEAPPLADCFAARGVLFVPTLRTYQYRAHRAAEYDQPDPGRRYLSQAGWDRWREDSAPGENDRNPEVIRLRETLVQVGQAFVAMLQERGAAIGAGTDFAGPGPVPGFSLHRELSLLAEAGLTPAQVLRAATRGPGARAGGAELQGRLLAGAPADLILLGEDAFADLSALNRIEGVVLRGRHLDRTDLDAVLQRLERE